MGNSVSKSRKLISFKEYIETLKAKKYLPQNLYNSFSIVSIDDPDRKTASQNLKDLSFSRKESRAIASLLGLAIGDALGAPVEFRPYEYLKDNPLREYIAGGTWGLQKGQVIETIYQ